MLQALSYQLSLPLCCHSLLPHLIRQLDLSAQVKLQQGDNKDEYGYYRKGCCAFNMR